MNAPDSSSFSSTSTSVFSSVTRHKDKTILLQEYAYSRKYKDMQARDVNSRWYADIFISDDNFILKSKQMISIVESSQPRKF